MLPEITTSDVVMNKNEQIPRALKLTEPAAVNFAAEVPAAYTV